MAACCKIASWCKGHKEYGQTRLNWMCNVHPMLQRSYLMIGWQTDRNLSCREWKHISVFAGAWGDIRVLGFAEERWDLLNKSGLILLPFFYVPFVLIYLAYFFQVGSSAHFSSAHTVSKMDFTIITLCLWLVTVLLTELCLYFEHGIPIVYEIQM